MKQKEGRDYLDFDDCVVSVEPGGIVRLSTMCETIRLSPDELKKLVKFVAAIAEQNRRSSHD